MNLLEHNDYVVCSGADEKELIINIALAFGVDVYFETTCDKRNESFPHLIYDKNYGVMGFFDPSVHGTSISSTQFIAKMLGVKTDKDSKKQELLDQIEALKKKVEELDKQ